MSEEIRFVEHIPDPIDAEVRLTIKDNKLEALLIVYPPKNGGNHVTFEQLKSLVEVNEIVYGVDYEVLENIARDRLYDTIFTFAHGDPAIEGEDGFVTPKYDQVRKLQPKILEDGTVDYRDLGVVVNIRLGDTICTIKRETAGKEGKDIFGQIIPATAGKPPIIPQGNNTGINGDGTLLLALASGNLIFDSGRFAVETVFTVKEDVDVSVGNINFMGDVLVKGNVEEGFIIRSESNITVMGMVNGGVLDAVGDVVVKNGVINSEITTKRGDVTIGFGESTNIKCKGNCKSNSFVSCTAEIEGDLEVIGNPGAIVGGNFKVMGSITCNTLGHRNYIATSVTVGNFASLMEERRQLEAKIAEIDDQIQKLNLSLSYLKREKAKTGKLDKTKEEFIATSVRQKVQKMLDKKPIDKRMAEIDAKVGHPEILSIKVTRFLHPNVKINMGSFSMTNKSEYSKCIVVCRNEGIEIKNG